MSHVITRRERGQMHDEWRKREVGETGRRGRSALLVTHLVHHKLVGAEGVERRTRQIREMHKV